MHALLIQGTLVFRDGILHAYHNHVRIDHSFRFYDFMNFRVAESGHKLISDELLIKSVIKLLYAPITIFLMLIQRLHELPLRIIKIFQIMIFINFSNFVCHPKSITLIFDS